MKTITLSATFDGEHIRLEDDYPLPKDAQLLVTVIAPVGGEADEEFRRDWYVVAAQSLAGAYDEDEPEYTMANCIASKPDSMRYSISPRSIFRSELTGA